MHVLSAGGSLNSVDENGKYYYNRHHLQRFRNLYFTKGLMCALSLQSTFRSRGPSLDRIISQRRDVGPYDDFKRCFY